MYTSERELLKQIFPEFLWEETPSPTQLCRKCGGELDGGWKNRKAGYLCKKCYNLYASIRYYLRPETRKINNRNSVCKRNGIEGRYTIEEWKAKLEEYNYCCAYCGEELLDKITADHVIPITRGGTNYISNIVPACMHCNCSKHNKTAEEFMLL